MIVVNPARLMPRVRPPKPLNKSTATRSSCLKRRRRVAGRCIAVPVTASPGLDGWRGWAGCSRRPPLDPVELGVVTGNVGLCPVPPVHGVHAALGLRKLPLVGAGDGSGRLEDV